MSYPLLVPRIEAADCLLSERELAPLVGIVAPDVSAMRGKGCLMWRHSEVFVTDDVDQAVRDRLVDMGVTVITVGPVDWDNLQTWKVEALKRLPITRWFRGGNVTTLESLVMCASLEGIPPRTVRKWIVNAVVSGVVVRRESKFGITFTLKEHHGTH